MQLSAEIDAILLLEDAGGPGESQLGQIVLIETFDQRGLSISQGGLSCDQRKIVIDPCVHTVRLIAERTGGQFDVGARDLHELRSGVHIEQGRTHLLVYVAPQVVKLGAYRVQLCLSRLDIAAKLGFAEYRDFQRALGDKDPVRSLSGNCRCAPKTVEAECGEPLAAIGIAN